MTAVPENFYDVQKKGEETLKEKRNAEGKNENSPDGAYEIFERWEHFMEPRIYPSGNLPDPDILLNEYLRVRDSRTAARLVPTANWNYSLPPTVPAGGFGAGRINCIAIHPVSSNIIFVGAACGGIWQSTNGGQSWFTSSDQLASISIADLAINPVQPNIMYAATGDGNGYIAGLGYFWGGTYSAGVMKSIDGGMTWNPSGLQFAQTQSQIVHRILVHPLQPNILIASTVSGIYRSINAGASWTTVNAGHFYDLEFNTNNPDIIYAAGNSRIYRSTNAGNTFLSYSNTIGLGGRISLAVTPADSTVLYAYTEDRQFYRSVNSGLTFTPQSIPPLQSYGYYDVALGASPVNPLKALVGGVQLMMTSDGGITWTQLASGMGTYNAATFCHADFHCMNFLPGNDSTFYAGNDGGLFRTSNNGTTFEKLNNGLDIKQYYRMSSSEADPEILIAGAQDNGTDLRTENSWRWLSGGDGMDCLADYSDAGTLYFSYQNGALFRSEDGGMSNIEISPCSDDGAWTAPLVQDPSNPNTLYFGACLDVVRSLDKGNTWDSIATGYFSDNITALAIAPANSSTIYAGNSQELFRTTNGGTSWTSISSGLPMASAMLSALAVSDANSQHVWASFSGYSAGIKVFRSMNGGNSWTNISGSLPNVPVDCLVRQKNSNGDLYAGTDFGVYFTNDTLGDWVAYQSGLPNVIVDDLEINYSSSTLYAATYGRGIWETDLVTSTLSGNDAAVAKIISPEGFYCQPQFIPEVRIKNAGLDTIFSVDIQYKVDGGSWTVQPWAGVLLPGRDTTVALPQLTVPAGQHVFTSATQLPNGVTDQKPSNDQRTSAFEVGGVTSLLPVTEGFEGAAFPLAAWRAENGKGLFSFAAAGGFGNSSVSLKADFYNQGTASGYLVSAPISLGGTTNPVLDFNLAYAMYNGDYWDTLKVKISSDCGSTWSELYNKFGSALATAPNTSSLFVPTAGDWSPENINLSAYVGFPELLIRFEFNSGYGNACYIDDINLHDATVGIAELVSSHVIVSPIPFDESISIRSGDVDILSVHLTDVTGKVLLVYSSVPKRQIQLHVHSLSRGMYFLKMETPKGTIVKKIMKG